MTTITRIEVTDGQGNSFTYIRDPEHPYRWKPEHADNNFPASDVMWQVARILAEPFETQVEVGTVG